MYLKHLQLVNFKNYTTEDFSFIDGINAIVGKNSKGKTNILDAIYYLSFTKSFSSANDSYIVNTGKDFFGIQGDYLFNDSSEQRIQCSYKKGQKKQVKRNKKAYEKLSDHIGAFPLVIISPLDSELISGGSELRRKLIDGVLSQYDKSYLNSLLKYNNALKQRNSLLKQKISNQDVMQIWEEQLCQFGTEIFNKRRAFIDDFIQPFLSYYEKITNDQQHIRFVYKSQLQDNSLETLLKENKEKDLYLQYTTTGIHRDDLTFILNDLPIKRHGSQGQQKTFLLALKLAQFQHIKSHSSRTPILLLDDIFDKLDAERVSNLLKMITESDFKQVFITDTGKERVENILKGHTDSFKIIELE